MTRKALVLLVVALCCTMALAADSATPQLPRIVKFTGIIPGASGALGVTFALYSDQAGGAPLWLETQNVTMDANGRYAVFLGANHTHGLPVELFARGEARWLGVQADGQAELPRVLLVSVPYALKSADADRFGGLPLAAFALNPRYKADPSDLLAATASDYLNSAAATQAANVISGAATGYLPMFTNTAGDMTSSGIFQNTNGTLGVNTTNPASMFHIVSPLPGVATFQRQGGARFTFQNYTDAEGLGTIFYVTDSASANYKPLSFDASSLRFRANGSDTNVLFVDGTGKVGIGTTAPAAKLEVAGNVKLSNGGTLTFPDGKTQTTAGVPQPAQACASGQMLKWDGANWSCANDLVGTGGGSSNPPQYIAMYGDSGSDLMDPYYVGVPATNLAVPSDQGITITKVTVNTGDNGTGTCSAAIARVGTGSVYEDVAVLNNRTSFETDDHALVFPAGSHIKVSLVQPAYCDPNGGYPGNNLPDFVSGSIRYRVSNAGEATSCPSQLVLYNGSCVDTQNDAQNCGSAGNVCPAQGSYATCRNGVCGGGVCLPGHANCDNNSANGCEINTLTDPNNCGFCGGQCSSYPITHGHASGVCSQGMCTAVCDAGYTACYAGPFQNCYNLQTDPGNCGACGNYCNSGVCSAGRCQ